MYQRGYEQVDKELDITYILTTLNQLKAGLSAVIGDDKELIRTSQEIYLNSTTITNED